MVAALVRLDNPVVPPTVTRAMTRLRSPGSVSGHRYGECVIACELLAEIERRIAATRWRWTLPLYRSEAARLRLARAHLRGSLLLRLLWPLAWAVGLSLVMAAFGAFDANLGLDGDSVPDRTVYVALLMGLVVAGLGRWATTSAAMLVCGEVAREMDANLNARACD